MFFWSCLILSLRGITLLRLPLRGLILLTGPVFEMPLRGITMLVVGRPWVGSVFCVGRVFFRVSVPLRGMTSGSERQGLASAKILHDCNVLPVNVINRLVFLARKK